MHKQTIPNPAGLNLMYSERWEVDHLCNRFGLSRATAHNLVRSYSGDRFRLEQEAERLGKYEKMH